MVEYLQADASGGFEPAFELELLDAIEGDVVEEGVSADRCEALLNGDILVEFAAEIGGVYTVQYSEDGESWLNVLPDVVSGGTRLQWIDNGPPKRPLIQLVPSADSTASSKKSPPNKFLPQSS